jgi:hypothetical protein
MKWSVGDEGYAGSLVRVNLLTNKEFKIKIGEFRLFETVAFIPSINKNLIAAVFMGIMEKKRKC